MEITKGSFKVQASPAEKPLRSRPQVAWAAVKATIARFVESVANALHPQK